MVDFNYGIPELLPRIFTGMNKLQRDGSMDLSGSDVESLGTFKKAEKGKIPAVLTFLFSYMILGTPQKLCVLFKIQISQPSTYAEINEHL